MTCIRKYYADNGKPSILYDSLVDEFGQSTAESIYLSTKMAPFQNWFKGEVDQNGEALLPMMLAQAVTADMDITRLGRELTVDRQVASIEGESIFSANELQHNVEQASGHINFEPNGHTYEVNGRMMQSVSNKLNEIPKLKFRGDPVGEIYSEVGTRYHEMVERLIKADDADIVSTIDTDMQLTNAERGFLTSANRFVSGLKKKASAEGATLISEAKIALTKKETAGMADIIYLYPDGKFDLYDLKSAHQTPAKRKSNTSPWNIADNNYYKASRYASQLHMYASILEQDDAETKRNGLTLNELYVVPIEVFYDASFQEGMDFEANADSIVDVTMKEPEKISSWGNKGEYWAEGKRYTDILLGNTKEQSNLKGYDSIQSVSSFMSAIVENTAATDEKYRYKATQIVDRQQSSDGFIINNKKYPWTADSREEKMKQVTDVLRTNENESGADLVTAALLQENKEDNSRFVPGTPATQRINNILESPHKKRVFPLSEIEGFEEHRDILAIETISGGIELIAMSNLNLSEQIEVKHNPTLLKNKIGGQVANGKLSTIVGNHITPSQARALRLDLTNTRYDYEKLRLAIIAMQLKNANPDLTVERILVQSFKESQITNQRATTMVEMLPQIKTISEIPAINERLTGTMRKLLTDPKAYEQNYRTDYVKEYTDYLTNELKLHPDLAYEDKKYKNENQRWRNNLTMKSFYKNEITKQELVERLTGSLEGMSRLLRKKYSDKTEEELLDAISSDREFVLLSKAVLSLNDMIYSYETDYSDTGFMKDIAKFIRAPTKTGRRQMDIFFDRFRQNYRKTRTELSEFKSREKLVLNELYIHSSMGEFGTKIRDSVLGMGNLLFDPLIQKKKTNDGRVYNTPYFWAEDSDEFKNLTRAQQKAIRFHNDEAQKVFRQAHPEIDKDGNYITQDWPRGLIPYLNASSNTMMYNAKRSVAHGELGKAVRTTGAALNRGLMMASNYNSHREDVNTKQNRMNHFDLFNNQFTSEGLVSDNVLEKMGLDSDMNLVDATKNESMDVDLENAYTRFMSHNLRKIEARETIPEYLAFRSLLKANQLASFYEQKDSIEWLDEYLGSLIYDEKVGDDKALQRFVGNATTMTSSMLIGFNPKIIIGNTIQNITAIFREGLTADMARLWGVDAGPGTKAFVKSNKIIARANAARLTSLANLGENEYEAIKLRLIMDSHMPDDVVQLQSRNNKVTQRGFVDPQMLFAIDRSIDHFARKQVLISNMVHDGVYDAYSVERVENDDGYFEFKLVYDEDKDPRDEKLKLAIKQSMQQRGEGLTGDDSMDLKDRKMTMAYDWRLNNKYKLYVDQMIGSFDKDDRSRISNYAIGNAMMMFRTWFRNMLLRSTDGDQVSLNMGNYVKTPEGYVWAEEHMRGWFASMTNVIDTLFTSTKRLIKDGEWDTSSITNEDKYNLILGLNTLLLLAGSAILSRIMWGDDEERKKALASKEGMDKYLTSLGMNITDRAIEDTLLMINLSPAESMFTTSPIIFVSFAQRLANTFADTIVDVNDGEMRSAARRIMRITPIAKEFEQIMEFE